VIFFKGEMKEQMIGDVNLFFSEWIEENESEVNIMIAVPEYRGKGLSREVMDVIEMFAVGIYERNVMIAKIKNDNLNSMKFF
jgi:RimJ/RimL family protein N-acetyltransferase